MSNWEDELSKIKPVSGVSSNAPKALSPIETQGRSFIHGIAYPVITKIGHALDNLGYVTQQSCGDKSCNLFVDESGKQIFKISIEFAHENGICRPSANIELSPQNVAPQKQKVHFGPDLKSAQNITSDDVANIIVEWFGKVSSKNP